VQGAKVAGAKHIVAVDPVEFKREIAPSFGATHTAGDAGAALDVVKEITWGVMADRVVLTPGVVPVDLVMQAMMLLRKGGTCVLTGVAKVSDMMVPLVLTEMVSSCKTLKGVLYGEMNPREAMPRLLSMYEAGAIKLDELITEKYTLDDINQGMKDLRAGKNIRGVIAFE
jgi:Zn-dependent alcohol dehydrogenase